MMDDDIIERRIQFRGGCFVLTIPRKIARKMGIIKGQSARFAVGNGEFTVRLTSVGAPKNPAKYESPVRTMINQTDEDVAEMVRKDTKHPKVSKLEKLRIK